MGQRLRRVGEKLEADVLTWRRSGRVGLAATLHSHGGAQVRMAVVSTDYLRCAENVEARSYLRVESRLVESLDVRSAKG